ncbi:hypothetical protein OIO90_000823 [Microbotryomycetes sp. JL221]|nr:hypothetical protein OIO90_000823 [Microbotryomycetes sp. JL221]
MAAAPAIPSVNMPAQNKVVELPLCTDKTVFEFVFSSPFVRGSDLWKQTPKQLQSHAMDAPVPDSKPIFVDGQTRASLSYGRLRTDAIKVASSLIHGPLGLRPAPSTASDPTVNRGAIVGPIVLLQLPNCLQFPVLAFGVLASGLTITACNPVLTPGEIAHILALSQPSVIVTTPTGLPNFQKAFEQLEPSVQQKLAYPTKGNVFIVDPDQDDYGSSMSSLNQQQTSIIGGWKVSNWKTLLPSNPAPFTPPRYTPAESALRAAVIFWSSGTSGKSKGVILSHRACSSALVAVWHYSTLGQDERLVGLPPFYHIFGWANVLMVSPAFGATTTTIAKFDPPAYLRVAQETRATHLHIAPPVAVLFAKSPLVTGFDLSSVKACTSGGAPLGTSVIAEVYKRLGIMVRMGYGLSETSGVTGQVAENWKELEKLLGSTGTVFGGTEVKVRSIEDGKTLQVGQDGEICIRSPYCAISYLNNPQATAEAFDDEGCFQVAPADLEDALCASPLVQDAGVTGVYNEEHATEYPRAWVVPFDKSLLQGGVNSEAFCHELRKHIEAKYAPYKWIRGGFVLCEAIPKIPSGKIKRRELKDTKGILIKVYEDKIRAKL